MLPLLAQSSFFFPKQSAAPAAPDDHSAQRRWQHDILVARMARGGGTQRLSLGCHTPYKDLRQLRLALNSAGSQGWLLNPNLPASISQILGLEAGNTPSMIALLKPMLCQCKAYSGRAEIKGKSSLRTLVRICCLIKGMGGRHAFALSSETS